MALVATVTKKGMFSDFTLFFYDEGILKYEPHASIATIITFIAVWIILVAIVLILTGIFLLFPGIVPTILIVWLIKNTVFKADPEPYKNSSFEELRSHTQFREINWNNITQITLMQRDSRSSMGIYYTEQHYDIGTHYDSKHYTINIKSEDSKKLKSLFSEQLGERFKMEAYVK